MTREEADFIGAMNMCDEISNEAYKKIMCHCEEQESCEDTDPKNRIARERYEDLVGYFGGNETILESREEFQKWLGRIKWHIKKCDKLAREVDELKKEALDQGLISRKAVDTLVDELARAISDERLRIQRGRSTGEIMQDILDLPSVTPKQKTGRWNVLGYDDPQVRLYKCSECHMKITLKFNYCPNCGAKMESEE